MINITSKKFIELFNSIDNDKIVENYKVDGQVIFNHSNYRCRNARILNCNFNH